MEQRGKGRGMGCFAQPTPIWEIPVHLHSFKQAHRLWPIGQLSTACPEYRPEDTDTQLDWEVLSWQVWLHLAHIQLLEDFMGGSVSPRGNGDVRFLSQLRSIYGTALSFDFWMLGKFKFFKALKFWKSGNQKKTFQIPCFLNVITRNAKTKWFKGTYFSVSLMRRKSSCSTTAPDINVWNVKIQNVYIC